VTEQEPTGDDPLTQVVDDLHKQFPAVDREIIAAHVRQAHAQMDSAPVQDYVPVLVQHQARLSLDAMTNADTTVRSVTDQPGSV
jgi:hypothetical protein